MHKLLPYKLLLAFCITTTITYGTDAQTAGLSHGLYVAFYNVENLFDTIHNPLADDAAFLPGGKLHWGTASYKQKVNNIASVLASMNDSTGPDIAGLAEVENRHVVEDVIGQPSLSLKKYSIVHKDSPDPRGIDVALIYKPDKVHILYNHWLKIHLEDSAAHTRDVLFSTVSIGVNDTLTFVVAHLPSRRGEVTEDNQLKRIDAAIQIRTYIDSVWHAVPHTRFVIMGDMNDTPQDESMRLLCQATTNNKSQLINLMQPLAIKKQYSLTFKGEGYLFDQFICSNNNLDTTTHCYIKPNAVDIYKKSWMIRIDKNGMEHPLDTHYSKHLKGYSDHWPVYAIFSIVSP